MERAKESKEILVSTENKIGVLHNIARVLSAAGINILAISGYIIETEAFLRLVVSDYEGAYQILQKENYRVESKDVIIVELDNKVGVLENITGKIEESGIDLKYIYGSVSADVTKTIIVISTSNNNAVFNLFNS